MNVGSFIEMFMTSFGWQLYGIVWDVISSTGLVYIPIIAAIVDNVTKPMQSQEAKNAATVSLRRLEMDLVAIILVILVCVQPMFTIKFGSLSQFNACANTTTHATDNAAKDLYGSLTVGNTEAKAPAWFYLVMTVSGAINDYVITSLPCSLNVREIKYQTNLAKITDPHLKTQVKGFVEECYDPAKADFFENERQLPSNIDNEDLTWAGSKYFRSTYYQNHYAKNPVVNFPFDETNPGDRAYYVEGTVPPQWGYPSCETWWSESEVGLQDRLKEEFPLGLLDKVTNLTEGSREEAEDIAVRKGLESVRGMASQRSTQEFKTDSFSDIVTSAVEIAGGFGAYVGGLITDMVLQPVLYFTIKMAPYIQATMLMSIYFLLPWILLIGNFKWESVKTGTVTIFAIKFWTSIWAVISLLDNNLSKAVKQYYGLDNWATLSTLTSESTFVTAIIDMLILSLYIGLPVFFLSMLAWGGESGAAKANSATQSSSGGAKQAGDAGVNAAKGAM